MRKPPLPRRVFSMQAARVAWNRPVGPGIWRLGIHCPPIARAIRPGQFVNLVPPSREGIADPLLPRPFSIFRAQGGVAEFLVQVVGRGTAGLASLRAGDALACFGPLGRGFAAGGDAFHIMIAGGIGVAPFHELGRELGRRRRVLLYGAATPKHLVCLPDFRRACGRVETIAVRRGRRRGLVTSLLEPYLERGGDLRLYACGPEPMLKAVWRIALERGLPCQLSLETSMACGMGFCKGCSFPRRGAPGYTLTCREGPVYEAAEIDFGGSHAA